MLIYQAKILRTLIVFIYQQEEQPTNKKLASISNNGSVSE